MSVICNFGWVGIGFYRPPFYGVRLALIGLAVTCPVLETVLKRETEKLRAIIAERNRRV